MTTRTYLPYDFPRCHGKTVDGRLVKPCNTCAREHFKAEVSPFRQPWIQPWLDGTAPVMGHCSEHIDMEYSDD